MNSGFLNAEKPSDHAAFALSYASAPQFIGYDTSSRPDECLVMLFAPGMETQVRRCAQLSEAFRG